MNIPSGFKFLKPIAIRNWDHFKSYDEIFNGSPEDWFNAQNPPALPLFISHRWRNRSAPDPDRQQFHTIRTFLRMIVQVATALLELPEKRTQHVPTPYVHGILQALSVFGAAHGSTEDGSNEWTTWAKLREQLQTLPPDEIGEAMINEIGIWYDFSCMPTSGSSYSEHTNNDVRRTLQQLSQLVAACPVIILRSEGDKYESRGWCAAELSIGREHHKHIVLRTDLIGQSFSKRLLMTAGDPLEFRLGTERLVKLLDMWTTTEPINKGELYRIHFDYSELAAVEVGNSVPFFTTRRRPEIFEGHRTLLETMIERMANLSKTDTRRGKLAGVDLAEIIRDAMKSAGLKCSVPDDLVFVGAIILEARNVQASELANFYRQAQRRWTNGQTLRLQHYREARRAAYQGFWRQLIFGRPPLVRTWYVFADEEIKERTRPKWARQKWISRLVGLFELDAKKTQRY